MDPETKETPPLDLMALDAVDESDMKVMAGDKPTSWVWTFCGPGHPRAIAQKERISRETLARMRSQEQAQVNRKKWKAPETSTEELQEDNVNYVLERLLRWNPVTLAGQPYPYSPENARALLMDPKKGALLQQAIEFINNDNSFTQRSAKN